MRLPVPLPPPQSPHLLVAVVADGEALALMEHAHGLHRVMGGTWSVVGLEAPEIEQRPVEMRTSLLEALDLAERLGATVSRISTGSHAPSAAVAALVHRVASEQASALMIGRAAMDNIAGPRTLAEQLPGVTLHVISIATAGDKPAPARLRSGFRFSDWTEGLSSTVSALAICTLACVLLQHHVHPTNLVMVYLAGVVYAAYKAGRPAAITSVAGSIFLYDLIFVAPRWSLKPTEPEYWMMFAVVLAVGLVMGHVASRSREQTLMAEARARRAQALNELSASLARARDADDVIRALSSSLRLALDVAAEVLLVREAAVPMALRRGTLAIEPQLAQRAADERREVGAGTALEPDAHLRYVPLIVGGDNVLAVAVMHPLPREIDSLEDRHLARALVNQAAVALERALFERRSVDAAVATERERLRSTLLAGLSHDFRTPLTTIVGNATTLLEQGHAIDEAARAMLLTDLIDEAKRMHLLSSNLLDLTRLEEGGVQPVMEWCPADELLEECTVAMGRRLSSHRLVIEADPDALVWCDPRLVQQVAANLLGNAVRHAPAGSVIRLEIAAANQTCTLTVQDAGPGVPAGEERTVFERFKQGTGRGPDAGGKGLGLAICSAVAQLHGGSIRVVNHDGARFEMKWPQPQRPAVDLEPM